MSNEPTVLMDMPDLITHLRNLNADFVVVVYAHKDKEDMKTGEYSLGIQIGQKEGEHTPTLSILGAISYIDKKLPELLSD